METLPQGNLAWWWTRLDGYFCWFVQRKITSQAAKKNIYETLGHKWILLKQHHSHNHQFWWHFLSGLPKIDHAENRLHFKWKSLLVMLLSPILIIGTSYIAKYWCIPNTGLSHNRIHPPNGNFSGDTSLPVISTYNPVYKMYNPIYNQL